MNRYKVLCTITMCVKCVTVQVHVGMGLIKVYVFIIHVCFGYKFLIVKSNFYPTVMLLKTIYSFSR